MHYHTKRRLRDQYETILRICSAPHHLAKRREHRSVTINRHAARALDYDNLVGGCKPLLDAMHRAGLIWDDSPEFVDVEYLQTKVKAKQARTVVTIR